MKELTQAELKELQRAYNRDYYQRNRERIRARQQQWRKENPDKVQEYNRNTWINRAKEQQNDITTV